MYQTIYSLNSDGTLGQMDWGLSGGDILSDNTLSGRVLDSLFTNRRASASDVLPHDFDSKQGWWGDTRLSGSRKLGSRLWLLSREKQTNETLSKARQYCHEAIQWLIDDGLVLDAEVFAEWTRPGFLGLRLTFLLPNQQRETISIATALESI